MGTVTQYFVSKDRNPGLPGSKFENEVVEIDAVEPLQRIGETRNPRGSRGKIYSVGVVSYFYRGRYILGSSHRPCVFLGTGLLREGQGETTDGRSKEKKRTDGSIDSENSCTPLTPLRGTVSGLFLFNFPTSTKSRPSLPISKPPSPCIVSESLGVRG